MDEEFYYNFFCTFLNNKKIKRYYYLKNEKDLVQKEKEIQFYIKEIKILDDRFKDTYLLLKDRSFNFLFSFGIVLSKNINYYTFRLKNDLEKKYISSEDVIKILGDKVFEKSKVTFDPNELKNIGFEKAIKNNKIDYLVKKIKIKKKINLFNFQVVEDKIFRNICPQTNREDFNLLRNLDIKFLDLLNNNNFLLNEQKYIYDDNGIKDILKPKFIYNEISKVFLNENLQEDISVCEKDYFLSFDKKLIINQIYNCELVNFDKENIILHIEKISNIKISQKDKNNFPLPYFIKEENDTFFEIENLKEFKKLSYVEFRYDYNFLKNLFLKTFEAETLKFEELFFKDSLIKIFENNKLNYYEIDIKFSKIYELILIIQYCVLKGIKIKSIYLEKKYNEKQILMLKNCVKKNFSFLIKNSISQNTLPKHSTYFNHFNEFLKHNIQKLNKEINTSNSFLDKDKALLISIRILNHINIIKKNYAFKSENLYLFYILNIHFLKIIKLFDESFFNRLNDFVSSYFKQINIKEVKYNYNDDYNIFLEFIKLKILSKKYNYILTQNDFFEKCIKDLNLKEMNFTPAFFYIKPNIFEIKKLFKNNYLEISKRIKNSEIKDNKINIVFQKRNIVFNEKYFLKNYTFFNFKIKYLSKYFCLYSFKTQK